MKPARLGLLTAASPLAPACQDEVGPTAPPDPVPNIAGTWSGTWDDDGFVCAPTQPVTVELVEESMRSRLRTLTLALIVTSGLGCGDAITQPQMSTPIPPPVSQTQTATPVLQSPTPTAVAQTPTPTPIPQTPTPTPIPQTPTPTPIPGPINLDGVWYGRIQDGSSWEQITVRFSQNGRLVSARVVTSRGAWNFTGTLHGGGLSLTYFVNDQSAGYLDGRVYSDTWMILRGTFGPYSHAPINLTR
jgi:hypothetical protein